MDEPDIPLAIYLVVYRLLYFRHLVLWVLF